MLGISSEKWSELFPNVPTVAQSLPGFAAAAWYGLFGPAGMKSSRSASIATSTRLSVLRT